MNNKLFKKIEKCRVCGNKNLTQILDLGNQYLSGIFPKEIDQNLHRGPLKLVKCDEVAFGCGHVQLEHTFDLSVMYGNQYGYRSGLNNTMVNHLKNKFDKIVNLFNLDEDDIVVDIAGNDGTFLNFFSKIFFKKLRLLSIDPTSEKFSEYFEPNVNYIPKFFSEEVFKKHFNSEKAKLITSFAMFYDLEDPCEFANQINNVLDPDKGIWVLEQSYMPSMVKMNSFDTICHEHLSYYGMRQLKYIMDNSNFKIIDFEFNDINGGSISLSVANKNSKYEECTSRINDQIEFEYAYKYNTIEPWKTFEENILKCKNNFYELINDLKLNGSKIAALGSSTKGNVILQTWQLNKCIEIIGDVNPDKHKSFTPGTWIPIEDEDKVLEQYDIFIVLPWHFKNFFIKSEKFKGKTLIFPLPNIEVFNL